jgi:hypothetical protein
VEGAKYSGPSNARATIFCGLYKGGGLNLMAVRGGLRTSKEKGITENTVMHVAMEKV